MSCCGELICNLNGHCKNEQESLVSNNPAIPY